MAERIGYGVIGLGARGKGFLNQLKQHQSEVVLRGVYDNNAEIASQVLKTAGEPSAVQYDSYQQMLDDPAVQWVLIMTPNYLHREHILAAFKAGKHVFAEKPLATTIEDCLAIMEARRAAPAQMFATGFVLRYSWLYRKAHDVLRSGTIGQLIAIGASENITPQHSGHIMTCWRRDSRYSGGHMLEKCCHDLDLLNWLIDDLPARVASFGGCNIFTPENAGNLNRFPAAPGNKSVYLEWPTASRDVQDPFTSEKNIVDNQVGILEYRNGVRVTFHVTMNNALPERRMYFTGTEGTMVLEAMGGRLELRRIGHLEPTQVFNMASDGHGGADPEITAALVESMAKGTPPACSGEEGVHSAVVALAIERARMNGQVEQLDPIWQSLQSA